TGALTAGSVAVSMSQLGRARDASKRRFDARLRADAALHAIRKEVASVLRSDDLFYTRLLLIDETLRAGRNETFDRDEILLFNTRVKPLRNRSEEHTSELQSRENLVCRLLLERKTTCQYIFQ